MAIEANKPVSGPNPPPSAPKQQAPQVPPAAPVKQPPAAKDRLVLSWNGRGEPFWVELPPGVSPSFLQKTGNSAYEFIARIAHNIKLALVFPTLDPDREVVGYAVSATKYTNVDGDVNVDIVPLAEDQSVWQYRGNRRPYAPETDTTGHFVPPQGVAASRGGTLHTEYPEGDLRHHPELKPVLEEIRRLMAQGKTPLVRLHGQWTYDPFHDGWAEIHPVRGIEIIDADAVPPAAQPPRPTSALWADSNPKLRVSSLTEDYTLRVGGTMGNGGGLSISGSKDMLTFGTTPGFVANGKGEIKDFKGGIRGTLAPEVTGILARDGNGQLRVGGALGVEYRTWGYGLRLEAVAGQAFAGDADRQGPYVGGRLSYNLNVGPAGSRMGAFVQVDKTLADKGTVTGTVGLSWSF